MGFFAVGGEAAGEAAGWGGGVWARGVVDVWGVLVWWRGGGGRQSLGVWYVERRRTLRCASLAEEADHGLIAVEECSCCAHYVRRRLMCGLEVVEKVVSRL